MTSQPKTILVVEDDPHLQTAYKDKLELSGFTVLQAVNGEDGLMRFIHNQPDAIVLDVNMPGVDGIAMLHALRDQELGKTVPVIVLTNDDTVSTVNQMLRDNAQAYFLKDETSLQIVVDTLRRLTQTAA